MADSGQLRSVGQLAVARLRKVVGSASWGEETAGKVLDEGAWNFGVGEKVALMDPSDEIWKFWVGWNLYYATWLEVNGSLMHREGWLPKKKEHETITIQRTNKGNG